MHLVDDLGDPVDSSRPAGNQKVIASGRYPDAKSVSQEAQMAIGRPEQFKLLFG
ncbi:MAG: hypothetical protein JW749_03185 [Sedimentisphaerales bacterium]|nr:hypothetical protein [Sedimentisphaerales bacterium]